MCYVWFSFKTCGLFFGTQNEVQFLPLKHFQAYSYNLYTYKKFRQKGIASQLHKFCNIYLKNKGIKERLCVIGPSFVGSMKISLSNGFEPKRMVFVYGYKNIIKVFLGSDNHVAKLNLWKNWFKATYGINHKTC